MSEENSGTINKSSLSARDPGVRDALRREPKVVSAEAAVESDDAGGARHRPGRVADGGERRLHSGPNVRLEPNEN
ncbi:hypothetical protein [Streptomyces syringium]|uniref:hypothetical protein n=1 Tax=Streptomyces syringium TaxID=76729 RepID=UPI0033CFEC8B